MLTYIISCACPTPSITCACSIITCAIYLITCACSLISCAYSGKYTWCRGVRDGVAWFRLLMLIKWALWAAERSWKPRHPNAWQRTVTYFVPKRWINKSNYSKCGLTAHFTPISPSCLCPAALHRTERRWAHCRREENSLFPGICSTLRRYTFSVDSKVMFGHSLDHTFII